MDKIVGVDAGGTHMLMTTKWKGEYIDRTVPTGRGVTPEDLKYEIEDFIKELPFTPRAVGMGVVGLVAGDTLKVSDQKGLEGMTTAQFETEDYSVYFINDVKAAMVCEEQFYDKDTPFVLIMAGTGFAMSIRPEGANVLGKNGWAGELGSFAYPVAGETKILDDLSGGNGILKQAGCTFEEFLAALENNDSFAHDILKRASFYFGLALSQVIHSFNPEYVVIGGGLTKFPGYVERAKKVAQEHTLEVMFSACHITEPKDAKRIVALGAAAFAERKLKETKKR